MSIFNDKTLKGVADAVSKVLAQESEATHPKTDKEKKLAALAHPKDKITHKDVLVGRGVLKKEETEQIDEVSKTTLSSYVKKASHDVAAKGAATRQFANDSETARKKEDYVGAKKSMEKADKTFSKSWKRREGMAKAVDRLAKEEFDIQEEQIDEAFPTVADAKKRMDAPKPSGGSGIKQGTRYGGSKQAPDAEEHDDDDKKAARGKYGARQNYKRSMKESFSEMISAYNEGGLKSLSQHLVIEEPDNEQFTKELEDQKASMEGKKKQPSVAAPSTQGVKNMPEEIELNADEINGVAIETISEELTLEDFSVEELEEFMMSEEYEQLDEISKATLASYVKKASHDVAKKVATTYQLANDSAHARTKDDFTGARKKMEKADMAYEKGVNRRMNMAKAVDRLAKEEVELEERTLTSGEKKEMEKNVKGMKKKLSGFKDRYGDRAKEVMYATATKMAKKD